ncbi:MAG: DUF1643 domain-containing protein [Pseudanabaenaceae cyanobacterium SKYGB_i_bin29]|nr:DUF1643 domain-containing protein [Pseudanabaenaceae cyanobacterium SKYG29]MDW8422476.1 DUF1643 domain-containing protein [Pseudanabaenaceae cyanobacterium SKYGB_i_bin29]
MTDIYIASNTLRFALGQSGDRPVLVLGLNPSTATDVKSDLTLSKVRRISQCKGFDGFIIANLCPIRSTHILALPIRVPDPVHVQNLAIISQIVKAYSLAFVWAAWGAGIIKRQYFVRALKEIVSCLDREGLNWLCYDYLTKEGHPRHPSRVGYGKSFYPFDVHEYTTRLESIYKDQ